MTAAVLPQGGVASPVADELALVRAMARGDDTALGRLYALHGGGVLAYLRGRVEDGRLAEELLQDVMLAAWRGAAAFRGDARVRTWLLAIAHNRCINARRRRRVATVELAPRQVDPAGGGDGLAERATERLDLRRAVAELPEDQRAALELVFYHGLALAEAAQVLGVAEGTIKSRLHRARGALRDRLDAPTADAARRDARP